MEIILLLAAVALLFACLTFKKNIYPNRKQERLQILKRYKDAQQKSIQLQETLEHYILENNAAEFQINEMTCNVFLENLKIEHTKNLNADAYNKIKNGSSTAYRKKVKLIVRAQAKRLNEAKKYIYMLEKNKSTA